jgi:Tfp pilus assembly protein PilO
MAIIAGNNKIYSFLMQCKIYYLYGASTLFLIILISGGLFFLYLPLHNAMQQKSLEIRKMQNHIKNMNRIKNNLKKSQESLVNLKQNLKDYVAKQPINAVLHDAMIFLTDCAHEKKLSIKTCRLCNQHDKKWCKINEITSEFSGTLEQLTSFFEKIKNSKRLIKCKKFELIAQENDRFSISCVFKLMSVNG